MRDENKLFSMLLSLDDLYQLFMDIGISINSEVDLCGYSYKRKALNNSIKLLSQLEFIEIENNILTKEKTYEKDEFNNNLIESIFKTFGTRIRIDLQKKLHYSIENQAIIIYKNAIPLVYAGLFMILADCNEIQNNENKWIIKGEILNQFFRTDNKKRKISLDELKSRLIKESELGEEAEQYALEYEKTKLLQKKYNRVPIQISRIDTAAGFDILSYGEDENDEKYIEVKSCNNDYLFHFTSNEIKIAKQQESKYWLYLFNRITMSIMEIQNPYKLFFENNTLDWVKQPDGYVIHKL